MTYPQSTAMLSVPGGRNVHGFPYFGLSFVYVIFEDGTDIYWARSRVLESLEQITARLPQGVAVRTDGGRYPPTGGFRYRRYERGILYRGSRALPDQCPLSARFA